MLETLKEKWPEIIHFLKNEYDISEVSVETWLLPLEIYSIEDESVVKLIVPDANFLGYLKKKYSTMLAVSIGEVTGFKCKVDFVVKDQIQEEQLKANQLIQNNQLMVSQTTLQEAGLNPKYTFDTFVVGANNSLAHAASLAVAESPGEIYNPLFIYGGVGLGKTHLMHAIGLAVLKRNPKAKILCLSATTYIAEFLKGIARKDQSFYQRFKSLDLLLLDDVQMLGSKEGTQSAFFSTFEALVPHGKQIVLTSDTYAKQLKDVDERLKSRFAGGMSVPIDPPELETREAILMKKAEQSGTNLPEDVAFFIANHLKSNVRELEGALQQVIAHARFNGIDISIDQARTALHDLIHSQNEITVQDIQKKVADYYKIRVADMHSKRRPRVIAYPRQIAMYLSKKLTQKSYPEIGELFGGKDHTTVLHACKKIESDRRINEELNHELHVLEQNLQNF